MKAFRLAILAAALALLTACGAKNFAAGPSPEPAVAEATPTVSAQDAESPSPDESGLDEDTVVMTVEGQAVLWPEFAYYLDYIIGYYKSSNMLTGITDWDAAVEGKPLAQYFLDYAAGVAKNHRGLEKQAEALGAGLTEAQKADIESKLEDGRTAYGENEFLAMVEDAYKNEDTYRYLMEIGALTDNLFNYYYGEDAENCADETIKAYSEQERYMFLKFIQVADTEDNRTLMAGLKGQLDQSGDPEALFGDLMEQYSESTVMTDSAFPGGAVFAGDYLGGDVYSAYSALKDNEISEILPSDGMLYLLLRLPFDPEMPSGSGGYTLRYCVAYALFQEQIDAWGRDLKADFTDAYAKIDVKAEAAALAGQ